MQLFTKEKTIEETLVGDDYLSNLDVLAENISSRCIDASNEATVVNIFDIHLFLFLREHFNLDYFPEKEVSVSTVRSIAKGRIDSKVGALVIEYKQPSKLNTLSDQNKASAQLIEYLNGLYRVTPSNYVGFVTDGVQGKLIEMHMGKITETKFSTLNSRHLDNIIKSVVLLDKLALTPENLIDNFCKPSRTSLVNKMVRTFYNTLQVAPTDRTKMLYQEWKELFKLAHDDMSKQRAILERSDALSKAIGEDLKTNEDEYRALYSLQTVYALIVKVIAYKVTSNAKFDNNFFEFNAYSTTSDANLLSIMKRLEDGAVFRDIGIGNLLEGDFFSWYSEPAQWNTDISESVRETFEVLSRYEDIAIFGSKNNSQDLFRELYLQIMPDKVRHSLGEFYTPTWLADNVVSNALNKIDKKVGWTGLDPCAGSGTFLNVMIQRVLSETKDLSDEERLSAVLDRVSGVDLNPLAVLAARVNYFINISPLFTKEVKIDIPVYLGDASYVPEVILKNDVEFYEYKIQTLKKTLAIQLPISMVARKHEFSDTMTRIEAYIKNLDTHSISAALLDIVDVNDRSNIAVVESVNRLAADFVELERNDWDGIWARIVTNFLLTANMSRVDIIVGNPPWIDWKTLPAGYRERIKGLCVSRHLFSGDRITGGINLNICALISNVAAQKWLKKDGVLAFLMPKPLLFQQSYEGFRNLMLDDGNKLYFEEIHDWTKSGHPFKPVQQEFLTYFISSKKQDYKTGIKVVSYKKSAGYKLDDYSAFSAFSKLEEVFEISNSIAFQSNGSSTAFSYANSTQESSMFESIAGTSFYKGREGIEFYPQELFLLSPLERQVEDSSTMLLTNYQNPRSKHKIASQKIVLEKSILHPLVKGVNINRFHIKAPEYVVPFPYTENNTRTPTELKELNNSAPLLAGYLLRNKTMIETQTSYNDRIIGKKNAEFYALARVGSYSFAPHHVAFRDNSKWQAAVISATDAWHNLSMPLFQNHAVSISERPDGTPISIEEAHYICAIMNAPIVQKYIKQSSDSRSFKIRPPIKIPVFTGDKKQIHLSELSIIAHAQYADKERMALIDTKLDAAYLELVKARLDL